MRQPRTVTLAELPDCDICKALGAGPIRKAVYDGKTIRGPWAYMCNGHFEMYGLGLESQLVTKLVAQ